MVEEDGYHRSTEHRREFCYELKDFAPAGFSERDCSDSFLPAFIGANPYAQAKSRGVKLIGATAHYATPDLDEGPIIEQDIARVSHGQDAEERRKRGADVERTVLTRAVQWHCEDRVMRHDNATVIL